MSEHSLRFSVTTSPFSDPGREQAALEALFKLMARALPAISERMGVPVVQRLDPDEYQRRHSTIVSYLLDNPQATSIPKELLAGQPVTSP